MNDHARMLDEKLYDICYDAIDELDQLKNY